MAGSSASRRPWQRHELLMAMNLYCRLPFGKMHRGNPLVVRLASRLGRTPSSVAMKLVNLASLDPVQQARGIRGLSGASAADRAVWQEFHNDWERLAVESELLVQPAASAARPQRQSDFEGPTAATREVRVRLGQQFFRRAVLASYGGRCCITGNPIRELLTASHIMPWSTHPDHRVDPTNGLCLARTHDAAFDQGLITFDENMRLVLSSRLKAYLPNEQLKRDFLHYEGQRLMPPERFTPRSAFMEHHRQAIFAR